MFARWRALGWALLLAAACRGASPPASRPDAGGARAATITRAELAREIDVATDFSTHTWRQVSARPGARVPVEGMWQRYAPFLGIPPAELVLDGPPRPSAASPN